VKLKKEVVSLFFFCSYFSVFNSLFSVVYAVFNFLVSSITCPVLPSEEIVSISLHTFPIELNPRFRQAPFSACAVFRISLCE